MNMHEQFQSEFHPEYSRMDRPSLRKIFSEHFPDFPESGIKKMPRHQLIALIAEQENSPESAPYIDQYSMNRELPLRRRSQWNYDLPKTMVPGQSMYYCWEAKEQALEAAVAIAKEEFETLTWNVGEDVTVDDLLLTVLATTPPLVTALETVTAVTDDKVYVEPIAVFSDPISLYDLETMIDSGLPRSSKALNLSTGKKVIKALNKLIKKAIPVVISAGQCSDSSIPHANDAVHVLSILQRDFEDSLLCDGCGRIVDANAEVHFFRPQGPDLNWDIQDHVDDVGLLCRDCHLLVHGPTKSHLRKVFDVAPPCPECRAGNPRKAIWGEPAIFDEDKYITMGCVLPPGPLTEWVCRKCNTPYAVVAHPEMLFPQYPTDLFKNRNS